MWSVPPCTSAVQRIIVMRHGERRDAAPDAPVESDPPLTEAGKAEVARAAMELQNVLGVDAAARLCVVSSPFARTLQTAMELQRHGIGAAPHGQGSGLIVDHGVCEVYGPVRIKSKDEPELWQLTEWMLPDQHDDTVGQNTHCNGTTLVRRLDGELPRWGETLEQAAARYVAAFQRIADEHSTTTTAAADEVLPMTATARPVHRRLPLRHRGGSVAGRRGSVASARSTSPGMTHNTASEPSSDTIAASAATSASQSERVMQDVLIVTHGDALHILLNHFYPARTVYNADYLSFLVFLRHGSGNPVFHLETAHGVQWIVDGDDEEPADSQVAASSTSSPPPPQRQVPQTVDPLKAELAFIETLWRQYETAEVSQSSALPTSSATTTAMPVDASPEGGATSGRFAAAVGVDAAERDSLSSSTPTALTGRRPRLPRRRPQRVAAPVLMSLVDAGRSELLPPVRATPPPARMTTALKDSLHSPFRHDAEPLGEPTQPITKLRPNGNEGCIRSCMPDGTPMQSSLEPTTLRARGVGLMTTGVVRRLGTALSRGGATRWRAWTLLLLPLLLRTTTALLGMSMLTCWSGIDRNVPRSVAGVAVLIEVMQGGLFMLSFRSAAACSRYLLLEQLQWPSPTAQLVTGAYRPPDAAMHDADDDEESGSQHVMTPGDRPDSTSAARTAMNSFVADGVDKQSLLGMTETTSTTRDAVSSGPYSTSSSGTAMYDIVPQSDSLAHPFDSRPRHASSVTHQHQAALAGDTQAARWHMSLQLFLRLITASMLKLVLIVVLTALCCTVLADMSWHTLYSELHDAPIQAYLVLLGMCAINVIRGCVEASR